MLSGNRELILGQCCARSCVSLAHPHHKFHSSKSGDAVPGGSWQQGGDRAADAAKPSSASEVRSFTQRNAYSSIAQTSSLDRRNWYRFAFSHCCG
ncbi:hypothetical protein ABL78_1477 [Leptomonas seymouri]|uniref:Uncharacterized protein n=1 Tax=Leptomonas seymouri TaxID=5684 RepID=A0A0N1PCZ5_LEPSE|nr:hypothetical protein ABL78_1477 [Leptomonas seymouri]|eukprot:KPI89441.1 hypothetical protein ABL78_1477 [Leptomonas seymouri]